MQQIKMYKPILKKDYFLMIGLLLLTSFLITLVSIYIFDTQAKEYFSGLNKGLERFNWPVLLLLNIFIMPIVEEFMARKATYDVSVAMSMNLWTSGIISAAIYSTFKVYMFGPAAYHFVTGILLYALYLKHRSFVTNVFYSAVLNALTLLILYVFTRIPSPAV